ncbi:MAG: hypothetical protein AB7S38_13260 [Vulcanimicrobiota bacterium]
MRILPVSTPIAGSCHRAHGKPANPSDQDQFAGTTQDLGQERRELEAWRRQLDAREAIVQGREGQLDIREGQLRTREYSALSRMYESRAHGPGPLESFVAGAAVGVAGLAIYLASH